MCADEGVDAIGINFVPSSKRVVTPDEARAIADAVRGRVLIVGVVADLDVDAMKTLRDGVGLECLQLHGDETPETLAPLLPHAYKAIRVGVRGGAPRWSAEDVARADAYGGDHVLLDGAVAGSGKTFDWSLARDLASRRRVTLAGGLGPENVEDAIRAVSPYCVDVASGVESGPRRKDRARVREFVRRARVAAVRAAPTMKDR